MTPPGSPGLPHPCTGTAPDGDLPGRAARRGLITTPSKGVIAMGFMDLFRSAGDQALYDARDALEANSSEEEAAGVTEETGEYLRLNNAVHQAGQNASWWARFNC